MNFFTWDAVKAESNLRKHKVSFDDAAKAFPFGVLDAVDDRHDYGEERRNRLCLCFPPKGIPLFITYAPREPNVIHLISARSLEEDELEVAEAARQEMERRKIQSAKAQKNKKTKTH